MKCLSPRNVALGVILAAYLGSLCAGMSATQPMVADEVVHYYMVLTQAKKLPAPNVSVEMPVRGRIHKRLYPHVFLWHYAGAVVWKFLGQAFWSVQIYHSLFWLQLLVSMWLLAKALRPGDAVVGLLNVVILASLPMCLLFSVLLFQDLPATAQVITSLMFLCRRQLWGSLVFMGIALSLKVTVFVFLPAYLFCIAAFFWRTERPWRTVLRLFMSVAIIVAMCAPMAMALHKLGWSYYPVVTTAQYLKRLGIIDKNNPVFRQGAIPVAAPNVVKNDNVDVIKPEICAHPGDLRIPVNWVLYFGGVFYVLVLFSIVGAILLRSRSQGILSREELCLTGAAIWILAMTAYHMRTAPDARFFMPGVVILVLPLARLASAVPWRRVWLPMLVAVAALQTGVVLSKTASLRKISPAMQEAIDFTYTLGSYGNNNIFMYPEGHERFMGGSVEWYLGYELRDLWRGNNDERIRLLQKYKTGVVIVKKNRIKAVSPDTVDLGVYPESFVNDIRQDPRFTKLFENSAVIIFLVPGNGKSTSGPAAVGQSVGTNGVSSARHPEQESGAQ
ncbi:MAG: hypothetical protein C0404_10710 [Verrucomicrobia bacterium]|nr:hypothetical protein [Verrucomicrobiota bacterium]